MAAAGEVERRFGRARSMRLSELHAATRDLLRAENLEVKEGALDRFTSVADVVERFRGEQT
jgi:hypothetical protein